jgi:hypothetical protein
MNAIRRLAALLVFATSGVGCAHGSSATKTSTPADDATQSGTPGTGIVMAGSSTTPVVPAPSNSDARTVALRWVASTGELLKMGPIGRSELLRQQVASGSAATMIDNLNADLAKLANGLPIPSTVLRLVETPLTVNVTLDPATGQARVQVWSVVVFGAKGLGAPRMVFRTSQLVLIVEGGGWKLAGFTAVDGPTPVATDALPADWDSFAVVAGWRPASAGER